VDDEHLVRAPVEAAQPEDVVVPQLRHGAHLRVQLAEPPNARAVAADPAHRQRRAVGQNGLVHDAAAGRAKDVRRRLQQRLQLQLRAAVHRHQHRAVAALLIARRGNSRLALIVCDALLGGEGGRRVRDFLIRVIAVVAGLLAQAAGKAPADGVRRLVRLRLLEHDAHPLLRHLLTLPPLPHLVHVQDHHE
jgi:hypothetical protein